MLNSLYQSLDPVAFTAGPFTVRWYGLSYVFGILLAAIICVRTARRWKTGITLDTVLTFTIVCAVGIIVGARLGYVLFYGEGYYFMHPEKILATSEGGMSFHGGLIGMTIALLITIRVMKLPLLTVVDLAAISAPIALLLVRCANFVNGELWGAVTDAPWGVVFGGGAGLEPRHPTQLYEAALEGLLLSVVLNVLARKRPPLPQGSYLGIFLVGYGVARIAVEFVRLPDQQIGYLFGTDWVTMGMVLTAPMLLVGAGFIAYAIKRRLPQVSGGSAATDPDIEGVQLQEADGAKKSDE